MKYTAKELSLFVKNNFEYFSSFDNVIMYYDDGRHELSSIITAILGTVLQNFELRKILPEDYKLFQSADLLCTLSLNFSVLKGGLEKIFLKH